MPATVKPDAETVEEEQEVVFLNCGHFARKKKSLRPDQKLVLTFGPGESTFFPGDTTLRSGETFFGRNDWLPYFCLSCQLCSFLFLEDFF